MLPHLAQFLATVAVVKIPNPSLYSRIDFVHNPLKWNNCPCSACESLDTIFDGLYEFLLLLNVRAIVPRPATSAYMNFKSKKIESFFVGVDRFRLDLIQGKIQPPHDMLQ